MTSPEWEAANEDDADRWPKYEAHTGLAPDTASPAWRDRGVIIANQQARIAELEAEAQRLRDDYQGALAEVQGLKRDVAGQTRSAQNGWRTADTMRDRAEAAKADAAGLRARIEEIRALAVKLEANWHVSWPSAFRQLAALAAQPTPAAECGAGHPINPSAVPCVRDKGHEGSHMSTTGCGGSVMHWSPTPAAEPHAEDGPDLDGSRCWKGREGCACRDGRPAPVADPSGDTEGGQA